jgi:hypothetical protein
MEKMNSSIIRGNFSQIGQIGFLWTTPPYNNMKPMNPAFKVSFWNDELIFLFNCHSN